MSSANESRQAATRRSSSAPRSGKRNTGSPNVVSVARIRAGGAVAAAAVREEPRRKSPVKRSESTAPLEVDLRGPEDVTRGVELQGHAASFDALAVPELAGFSGPVRVPAPVHRDRLGRSPHFLVPRSGVIAVRVGNDRAPGGDRRVDRRLEGRAEEPLRPDLQEGCERVVHHERTLQPSGRRSGRELRTRRTKVPLPDRPLAGKVEEVNPLDDAVEPSPARTTAGVALCCSNSGLNGMSAASISLRSRQESETRRSYDR